MAWHGGHSSSAGWLELPAQLCAALQLPTGTEVFLEVLHNLAAAAAVVVEPVGPADWEVVELNAGQLEGEVLQQVRGGSGSHTSIKVVMMRFMSTHLGMHVVCECGVWRVFVTQGYSRHVMF